MTQENFGYARISTSSQDTQMQMDALEKYGCTSIFGEQESGAKRDRARLDKMLSKLRVGDQVVVWRMDRLARSLKDLLEITSKIEAVGAEFVSLTEKLDTSSAGSHLIFNVFAGINQFERQLLVERTKSGLKSARRRGRLGGRPKKFQDSDIEKMKLLMDQPDQNVRTICERFGISRSSLYRLIQEPVAA
jgi:DNA invertase Pin-like site-specific DNA recombinase